MRLTIIGKYGSYGTYKRDADAAPVEKREPEAEPKADPEPEAKPQYGKLSMIRAPCPHSHS